MKHHLRAELDLFRRELPVSGSCLLSEPRAKYMLGGPQWGRVWVVGQLSRVHMVL